MVEYSPLIRLVGAVVLHQNYPRAWCGLEQEDINFAKEDGFFVVTPAVNAIISTKAGDPKAGEEAITEARNEADAGAGGRPKIAAAADDSPETNQNENESSP